MEPIPKPVVDIAKRGSVNCATALGAGNSEEESPDTLEPMLGGSGIADGSRIPMTLERNLQAVPRPTFSTRGSRRKADTDDVLQRIGKGGKRNKRAYEFILRGTGGRHTGIQGWLYEGMSRNVGFHADKQPTLHQLHSPRSIFDQIVPSAWIHWRSPGNSKSTSDRPLPTIITQRAARTENVS